MYMESLLLPELASSLITYLFSPSFLDGICSPCLVCSNFSEFSAFNMMFIWVMAFIMFNCGDYLFFRLKNESVLILFIYLFN